MVSTGSSPTQNAQSPVSASPDSLQRILALEKSSPQFPEQLAKILDEDGFRYSIECLQEERLEMLVNELDDFLDTLDPTGLAFSRCQRELTRVCGTREILPKSYTISQPLSYAGIGPVASGAFADVYEGSLNDSRVSIKQARIYSKEDQRGVQKLFYQEAVVWKHLNHPNIVPFQGITTIPLQLVSDWMPGGDLTEYTNRTPDVDRLRLVGPSTNVRSEILIHHQLGDVAKGLDHLHSRNIIHGDLKGPNILVDGTGHARITDFGFAIVTHSLDAIWSGHGHNGRWTAPEVLDGGKSSKKADIFSFAMVMIEVYTGAVPFESSPSATAIMAIVTGKRPPRPTHAAFTDNLWGLMKRCWDQEPHSRPETTELFRVLCSPDLSPNRASERVFPNTVSRSRSIIDSAVQKTRSFLPSSRSLQKFRRPGGSSSTLQAQLSSTLSEEVHRPSSDSTALQRLYCLDRSSSEFHHQLSGVLYGEDYRQRVPNLQGDDLVWLIDYLDKALDNLDPAGSAFRKCLRELRHICGTKTMLPTSYTLSSSLLNIGRQPVTSGGSGDLYEGTLNDLKVCIKRPRVYSKDGSKRATRTLCQEAVVWKRLEHQNIVPLLGITSTPIQLISEWMTGGDLTEYIKEHPAVDRLCLLSDVAEGLRFLHSRNIVHGDLKGPNVLVDTAGRARITDFGLATVTQNLDSIRSASEYQGHTARWTAPEILTEQGTYSKEADVFSFAMVMIEVFTGAVPFNNSLPAAAMLAIMAGKRPPRPTHPSLTDDLWTLMQRCWNQDPQSRPDVSAVSKVLHSSDLPLIQTSIYRLPSASALTVGQEQSLVVTNNDSRSGLNHDLDNNDEGKYWFRPQLDKLGASHSAPNVGDGSHQGGQNQDPTRAPAHPVIQGEPQGITIPKPFDEQQSEPWIFMPPRQEEPYNNLHIREYHTHLGHGYKPPSQLPGKRWNAFKRLRLKFHELFRSTSEPLR